MTSPVEVNGLTFNWPSEPNVLQDISFTLREGELVGLIGENGAGKSTLIRLLMGLLRPGEGEIRIFGEPSTRFKDWWRVGYVSQQARQFNADFPATAGEIVRVGLVALRGHREASRDYGGRRLNAGEQRQAAAEALEAVDLAGMAERPIRELSGGQQQRVFIARALVTRPSLLILDEPTAGVDIRRAREIVLGLLRLTRQQGLTVLLVSHDVRTLSENADRLFELSSSSLREISPETLDRDWHTAYEARHQLTSEAKVGDGDA